MKFMLYKIKQKILIYLYKYLILPKHYKNVSRKHAQFHIKSIEDTALELANTNKSLGRFGDGEIGWIIGNRPKYMSFEKNSKNLSIKLLKVLQSHNKNFLIGLPDAFHLHKSLTTRAKLFWSIFFMRNDKYFLNLLSKHKQYYNTSVTRPYIDYNNRCISIHTFDLLKNVWKRQNLLIVEGKESRVGADDDLFDGANTIKRIECPIKNAFESYNLIKNVIINFLQKSSHKFIVLISLGPTATILSYDLSNLGYRAIDIGHLDLEYEWYLIGAKEKINLPYKYVNENKEGHSALPEKNRKYYSEILTVIK